MTFDEERLDDEAALTAGDPGQMLRAVATAGAQVRASLQAAADAGLDKLGTDGRPRAVVTTGMGGSGIAGDVLAAICGLQVPVPIIPVRGYALPGWVGAMDLVVAVSCSGATEETLSVLDEARRRGSRVLSVGAPSSPLADLSDRAHGLHVAVDGGGRQPRANLWALSVPLLVAADLLGLAAVPTSVLTATADQLDALADRCRPSSDAFVNPAKALAAELAGAVPMIWGTGELGGVAAYRFACQLNENAKLPAVYGTVPEANHNQVVTFDGAYAMPYAMRQQASDEEFFRDRIESTVSGRMRLVVLRDTEEHPQVARRREVSIQVAADRGIPVSEVTAEGAQAVERLATLVGLADFASVYLALGLGIDPTPVQPIVELKERIAR